MYYRQCQMNQHKTKHEIFLLKSVDSRIELGINFLKETFYFEEF